MEIRSLWILNNTSSKLASHMNRNINTIAAAVSLNSNFKCNHLANLICNWITMQMKNFFQFVIMDEVEMLPI